MSAVPQGRFRLQFRLGTVLLLFAITGLAITLVKEVVHRRMLERRFETEIPRGHVWLWSLSPNTRWSVKSNVAVVGKAYLPKGIALSSKATAEVTFLRLAAGESVPVSGPVQCVLKQDNSSCYSFSCTFKHGTAEFPDLPAGSYLVEAKVLDNGTQVVAGVARVTIVDSSRK